MKNLLGLLLILIICFTSCEGRKTQNQALSESIEEFKNDVTLQIDIYEPETYEEYEVDTLLSNGYRVKIKTSTDMNSSVLFTKIKDSVKYNTYYRNYELDILVEKEGKLIYREITDKSIMNFVFGYTSDNKTNLNIEDFDTLAVLKFVQVDDELSSNEAVYIDIAYSIPNNEYIDWHKLKINSKGQASFVTTEIR